MNKDYDKKKAICFLGNISEKKGPWVLLQAFKAIHDFDNDFTLHIGGAMQSSRVAATWDYLIPELGLSENIHYYGFVEEPIEWLKNFSYGINTSPWEGHCISMMQYLSVGLQPLFHNHVGIENQYPKEWIWSSISELLTLIQKPKQDPEIFKKFVKDNYSQKKQFDAIDELVEDLLKEVPKQIEVKKNSSVACVIAVKNGASTIEKSINSLLKQTYPLEKIVVVNDASIDNTLDIVSKIKSNSKIPIEIVSNPVSNWVFSSRNEGVEHIDTDYFFFLDADDFIESNFVEKAVQILDKNSVIAVVYSDIIYFDNKGNEKVFHQPEFNAQLLAQQNFIAYASMQRTEVFKELGGFSEYMNDCRNHLTEWELWLRYVKKDKNFIRLPEPLFHYFHDDNSKQMSIGQERSRNDQSLEVALELADDPSEIQMIYNKKRIILVCQGKDYLDKSKVGFELFTWYKPLEEFGDVFIFQYDVEMKHYGRPVMQERLKTFINLIKPDYIFHPTYKADIYPETWKVITKEYNTIAWNSDDNIRYESFTKDYAQSFAYTITTYPLIFEEMTHPGRILSQWGVNQFYFKPAVEKDIDVSFCGQKYGERIEFLDGLNVECYGSGWSKNSFLDFPVMAIVLGRSKISINFSKGGDNKPQLKLRPFEICASGALCLCEAVDDIEKYYIPGKEIILFKTKEELSDLIGYYLEHFEERKTIAQAGYKRTMKDHLWTHRFKEIFSFVDEDKKQIS